MDDMANPCEDDVIGRPGPSTSQIFHHGRTDTSGLQQSLKMM